MIECANITCHNTFTPKTISNKYCSSECRSETTNNNLKDNYWRKKHIKDGTLERMCNICARTKLSRYNKEDVCGPCLAQRDANARNKLLAEMGAA